MNCCSEGIYHKEERNEWEFLPGIFTICSMCSKPVCFNHRPIKFVHLIGDIFFPCCYRCILDKKPRFILGRTNRSVKQIQALNPLYVMTKAIKN